MSKKIVTVSILRITYEPNMDEFEDIEKRIREGIEELLAHGKLEGCEHGAHVDSWKLEVSLAHIE
jgi:hypothetical protein